MKKFLILLALAAAAAIAIRSAWPPVSFAERAVTLELQQKLPDLAGRLAGEPLAVQALFLDYAGDDVLLLKAQAALMRYPRLAREVLPLYGDLPEFRAILRTYGDSVLLPIAYFLDNDVRSVELAHAAAQKMKRLVTSARSLIGGRSGPTARENDAPLSREGRGWYAVNYIRQEGHDFLGQFVLDHSGAPRWIQTERALEALSSIVASGIRELEVRVRSDAPVTVADAGWASVDMLAMLGAVKLLRVAKAAAEAGKPLGVPTRTAALTLRLARGSERVGKLARLGRWPALAAAAWMALRHPGIVSDALAAAARALGVPAGAMLIAGWMLLLLPALYLASWLLRFAAWLGIPLLRGLLHALTWLDGRSKRSREYAFLAG